MSVKDGGVAAIMCAYNSVQDPEVGQTSGHFNCQNQWLLNNVLRGQWGFKVTCNRTSARPRVPRRR